MFKVLCYDNGATTYVCDVDRNDYNEPTTVYRTTDEKMAIAFCGADAEDIENTLGGNGFVTDRVEVPDTEPLYVIKGHDWCHWTEKLPVTYDVLLGLFYGETDVCNYHNKHLWMREYLHDIITGERKEKNNGVINFLEAYWDVRIDEVK